MIKMEVKGDYKHLERDNNAMIRRIKEGNRALVQSLAQAGLKIIQQKASGRPGPNVVTGGYLASIQVTITQQGFVLYSNHPAAARLEYGFTGMDAIGRHYTQPPFPHWRPGYEVLSHLAYEKYGVMIKQEVYL